MGVPRGLFPVEPRLTISRSSMSTGRSYLKRHLKLSEEIVLPEQLTLFASQVPAPDGLIYREAFISPAEERGLIACVSALPLRPFQFGRFEGKRRVASFGSRYDYTQRQVMAADPIPPWLDPLVERVEALGGPGTRIQQVLCTEYDVGVGIGWHRDKPHYDRVFGLSLGSACKLRFRKSAAAGWERFKRDVQPRSIYIMGGPSRHVWEHSIPAVDAPRTSITFRTMAR
jgi:alkylated DNA repair dioxygenase AlkB